MSSINRKGDRWCRRLCVAAALVATGGTGTALAQVREYVVDSGASYLEVDIDAFSFGAYAQDGTSNRLYFQGSIFGDRANGNLAIEDTSDLDALLYDDGDTDLSPASGGGSSGNPGEDPADAGLVLTQFSFDIGHAALRGVGVELESTEMTVSSGAFNPSAITGTLLSGSVLDYNFELIFPNLEFIGSEDLEGDNGANELTSGGLLTDLGNGDEGLYIPLQFTIPVEVDATTIDVILQGQLVATYTDTFRMTGLATVPEPATFVMLLMGLAALPFAARRIRRTRRKA